MAVTLDLRDDPNGWVKFFPIVFIVEAIALLNKIAWSVLLAFILELNMMLAIAFHALVLRWHMDNK